MPLISKVDLPVLLRQLLRTQSVQVLLTLALPSRQMLAV